MSDDRNVLEIHGVFAGEQDGYKGDVTAHEAGKTVRIAVRGYTLDMTPEAAITLSRMLSRCARRIIARRQPPK